MFINRFMLILIFSCTFLGCLKENVPSCSSEEVKSRIIQITRFNYRDLLARKEKNEVFRSKEYQDFFKGDYTIRQFAINYVDNFSDLVSIDDQIGCPVVHEKVNQVQFSSENALFDLRNSRINSVDKDIKKSMCSADLFSGEDYVVKVIYSVQLLDDGQIYVETGDIFR